MSEAIEILQIIGCGILGVSLAMFFKMQDITTANDNLNFKEVAKLFFKKGWATYGASITMVVIYAVTHEDWIEIFTGEKESHSIVTKIIHLVMVMGAAIGFICQYGAYRFLLPKLDRLLKTWGGTPPSKEQVVEENKDK